MIFIIDKLINYIIYIFLMHWCFRIPYRKNKICIILSFLSCAGSGFVDNYLGNENIFAFIIWAIIAMVLLFEDRLLHVVILTVLLTWFMGMMDTFSSITVQILFLGADIPNCSLSWQELLAYPISFSIEYTLYYLVLKKANVYLDEIKLNYKIGILFLTLIFELVVVGVFGVYYSSADNYTWYLHVRFIICLIVSA